MPHDSYKNWMVTGYTRKAVDYTQDGLPVPLDYTELVTVVLDGHRRYEVVLDDAGAISELTLGGADQITPALLRKVPLGYLAEAAQGHRRTFEGALDEGLGHDAALAESEVDGVRDDNGVRGGPPTPEEFAAQWHRTPRSVITPEGIRVTRRQALAEHFCVSVWSIDKWSRSARDRGLIGRDKAGAPRGSGTDSKRTSTKKTRGSTPRSQN